MPTDLELAAAVASVLVPVVGAQTFWVVRSLVTGSTSDCVDLDGHRADSRLEDLQLGDA